MVEKPDKHSDSPNDPNNPASQAAGGQAPSTSTEKSEFSGESPPQDATAAGGPAEVSQSDIDALLQGSGLTGSAGSSESPASAGSDAVDQADIDALFGSSKSAPQGTEPETHAKQEPQPDSLRMPYDEAAAMTRAAKDEEQSEPAVSAMADEYDLGGKVFEPAELEGDFIANIDPQRVTMLSDVKLKVRIQLGRTRMLVEDVLKLGEGSVVELDKLAGDPVDVLINDRLVARGEVLVLNDNFCVRVSEVLSHDPHRIST